MIGGQHTVQASPTQLSNNDRVCRSITIRLDINDSQLFFADADNASTSTATGYLTATATAGESWTFGPLDAGSGIRASDIYLWGTAGDKVYWVGV
jgi:hypothetical protein